MGIFVQQRSGRGRDYGWVGVSTVCLALGCGYLDRDVLDDLFDGGGHHGGGDQGGGHGGGGGEDPAGEPCSGSFSFDELYVTIANDVARLDAEDAPFARYLTLANTAETGGCGAVLDVARSALDKLVNSVSTGTVITRLAPVDADLTLYRLDLRDYDWDREVVVDGVQFDDGWEAIVASSVYAVPFIGDDAADAVADTGTAIPVLFGDAFVASVAKAPLYYALLGIPEDIDAFLLQDLQLDVEGARAAGEVVRAGLGGTGAGLNEFLVERFDQEIRSGSVWQIFSDEAGADALLEDPLSTPESEEREIVFTLPNGLLGHVLADADGRRLDDSELLLDANQNNFRALIAATYFRFRAQGVSANDEIRQFAIDNSGEFSPEELARILVLYPSADDLEAIQDRDRDAFGAALQQAGSDISAVPEPISEIFLRFDRDVDLATAAGDLLVSAEDLEQNLALLNPALGALSSGFVDRDDFSATYVDSLCILSVVNSNLPEPEICSAAALAR